MEIRILARDDSALRCVSCHDGAGELVACTCCGVTLHEGCRSASFGCPTLGCASGRLPIVVKARKSRAAWLPWLMLHAGVAAASAGVGLAIARSVF